MKSLKNILVGLDIHHGDRLASTLVNPSTQAALEQAVELASKSGATLTLCTVLEISEQAAHLIELDHQNLRKTVEDTAQEVLARIASNLSAQGITVKTVVRIGNCDDEMIRQIIDGGHDLVVTGSRNRSAATRLLFGSTAQKLIRFSPCPVWVCKPGEVREVREVLVASDLSETAGLAVTMAADVARILGAKLFAVHALEFPFETYLRTAGVSQTEVDKYRANLHAEAKQGLEDQLTVADYRTLPHGVQVHVLEGSPDEVVPKFIDENEIDVVVIGTHGRRGLTRMMLGNTAERLLPYIHASLLAVKPAGFVSPLQDGTN